MSSGLAESGPAAYEWVRPQDRPHKYHLSLARRSLRDVELSGRRVLEIGSGRGGNCYYLSHYTGVGRAYGLDSSFATVRAAGTIGASKAGFLCGAAEHLPFRPNTFDVVLSIESSPSYPALETLLAEAYHVLVPGGLFIYMDLWNEVVPMAKRRTEALHNSPLTMVSNEDVTEDVFEALNSPDGMEATMRAVARKGNPALVQRIIDYTVTARESLAVGFFAARIIRMVKRA